MPITDPTRFQIGPIPIAPNMILAPMSGVTDAPFRSLVQRCSDGHVGLMVTEFIAIERLTRADLKAHKQMRFDPAQRPIAVQLFGADIDAMLQAADIVQQSGADILDINCGCPAPKVVGRGGGAGLLRQLDLLHTMTRALTARLDIPVTLKIRNGWDDAHIVAHDVLDLAEDAGIAMLAIHGRTRAQLYRGEPDWEIVAALAARARIPIVGSGNVTDWETAHRRLTETGCAGIMIGRAALKNPFIFRQLHEARSGLIPFTPTIIDVLHALEYYLEQLKTYHEPRWIKARMKRMGAAMVQGYPGSARLRRSLFTLKSPEAILGAVREFSRAVANRTSARSGRNRPQMP